MMRDATVTAPVLCLASASPRRRELLDQIGVRYLVRAADVDETPQPAEPAPDYVLRVALAKARAIVPHAAGMAVLAADTAVVLDGALYGKPRDRAHARAMLGALGGRTHEVLTAVALAHGADLRTALSVSEVRLRPLTPAECDAYWDTGEPCDKAGAYAIQGRGAVFVEHLRGSYSGVMGLPLAEVATLLQLAGVPYWLDGAAGADR
jgi:septum formation protein